LDASMYYVDKLVEGDIPMYVRVDVGLTWRPTDHLELSVGARNLQDDRHQELSSFDTGTDATEVPREFYGKVALSY
jgi:outer membrane receptor for ferrienterochelin and colicin